MPIVWNKDARKVLTDQDSSTVLDDDGQLAGVPHIHQWRSKHQIREGYTNLRSNPTV